MSDTRIPWAHVGHKDGYFGGVISADLSHHSMALPAKEHKNWKREIAKFCGDFIADGYTITTVYSREEYEKLLGTLTHEKPKKKLKAKTEDLFGDADGN